MLAVRPSSPLTPNAAEKRSCLTQRTAPARHVSQLSSRVYLSRSSLDADVRTKPLLAARGYSTSCYHLGWHTRECLINKRRTEWKYGTHACVCRLTPRRRLFVRRRAGLLLCNNLRNLTTANCRRERFSLRARHAIDGDSRRRRERDFPRNRWDLSSRPPTRSSAWPGRGRGEVFARG